MSLRHRSEAIAIPLCWMQGWRNLQEQMRCSALFSVCTFVRAISIDMVAFWSWSSIEAAGWNLFVVLAFTSKE